MPKASPSKARQSLRLLWPKASISLSQQKQQADIDQKYAQFEAAPEKVEDGKHIYGDLGARFTLVEFSDMECPSVSNSTTRPSKLWMPVKAM